MARQKKKNELSASEIKVEIESIDKQLLRLKNQVDDLKEKKAGLEEDFVSRSEYEELVEKARLYDEMISNAEKNPMPDQPQASQTGAWAPETMTGQGGIRNE